MPRFSVTLSIILICVSLQGCVVRSSRAAAADPAAIRLVIENREFDAMNVYLAREGVRIPIGTVDGFGTRTFAISRSMLPVDATLVLVAVSRACSEVLQSPSVSAQPGQVVSWRIERASFGRAVLVR